MYESLKVPPGVACRVSSHEKRRAVSAYRRCMRPRRSRSPSGTSSTPARAAVKAVARATAPSNVRTSVVFIVARRRPGCRDAAEPPDLILRAHREEPVVLVGLHDPVAGLDP